MKKELAAIVLILLSFSTGMILTAATSGCDTASEQSARSSAANQLQLPLHTGPINQPL